MKLRNTLISTYRANRFLMNILASGPYSNPLAYAHQQGLPRYDEEDLKAVKTCEESSKLVINNKDLLTLEQYFAEQQQTQSVMGDFYNTLTFEEFLLRLFTKRYKVAFLNGSLIIPRHWNDVLAQAKPKTYFSAVFDKQNDVFFKYRNLLMCIGTEQDHKGIYREYLTLDEMMLTPCILAQTLSIIVGNGTRSPYPEYYNEAHDSIPLAVMNCPIGAEFNDGLTLHNDLLMIVVPEVLHPDLAKRRTSMLANPPLLNAARQIYGTQLALDFNVANAQANQNGDFVKLTAGGVNFWLFKPAYMSRTQNMLKTLLLSADREMHQAGNLGDVFNLKGIGLGAFGFSELECRPLMEQLYVECVQQTLAEIAPLLKHIRCVNLINLPSDFANDCDTREVASYGAVKLIRSVMSPTSKKIPGFDHGVVGGTHFCGDSAAKVGNEGLVGAFRNESDDPATLYSMLNPKILDPDTNKRLASTACLHVVSETTAGLVTLDELAAKPVARHN